MILFSYLKSNLSILNVIGEYTHLKKPELIGKVAARFTVKKTASLRWARTKKFLLFWLSCWRWCDQFIANVEHLSQLKLRNIWLTDIASRCLMNWASIMRHHFQRWKKAIQHVVPTSCTLVPSEPAQITIALHYLLKRGSPKKWCNSSTGLLPGGLASIKDLMSAMGKHHILPRDW